MRNHVLSPKATLLQHRNSKSLASTLEMEGRSGNQWEETLARTQREQCSGHQALADERPGPTLKEDRYLVNHLAARGKKTTGRIQGGSTLQPPNKSPPHMAGARAPHVNVASSGGFAVGPEVTVQEAYKNSAHDGDNPIRPGALA